MENFSSDKTVRNNTVKDLKDFNNHYLATQAKKGEQIVSMMPVIKKAFDLMGDDIIELSTKNDASKDKLVSYDEKWLVESKAKLLKQVEHDKRANLIMFRMKKQR